MASINLKNISDWSLTKKIIFGVVILLIIWILWSIFGGPNTVTQNILKLPEATIQIVNEGEEEIELQVRVNNTGAEFAGVRESLIEETVLYHATAYSASASIEVNKVKVPLALALFEENGNLINIYKVKAGEQKTITPEGRYKYTLMAEDGYFAEKGISMENGSKILPDTLQITEE